MISLRAHHQGIGATSAPRKTQGTRTHATHARTPAWAQSKATHAANSNYTHRYAGLLLRV